MKHTHKPGYKNTPLGWIPDEWQVTTQGEIAVFINGKAYKQEELLTNGKYRVLRVGNFFTSDNWYYSDLELDDDKYVSEDDLMYAWSASFGPRYWHGEKVIYHYHIWKIKCTAAVLKQYMFFSLDALTASIKAKGANGMGILHITKGEMENTSMRLPPLPEQQKIATILTTWDEAIQKTQQLIAQLKQRNKGLMQQLLSGRNWKEYKLLDIFERVTRKNTEGNTNVITISAQRGFVRQGDFFNKQVASEILDNYFLVEKGEFCYNKSYSNGYDWGATKRLNDFEKAVVTTLYICFRLKDESKHSGDFFEYFFESGLLDVGLSKIAHEGGRAHGLLNVTPTDFFNLKISVPDKANQVKIYKILQEATNELKLHEQQLITLQQQKKGLMQKLLSGEVRVKM